MSTAPALSEFGRQLEDAASLGRAVDELLAARTEVPALLALGEPTHGIKLFRCCATNFSANWSNEDIGRSCSKQMSLRLCS